MANVGELPAGFVALEPFVNEWALGTSAERLHKRMHSNMADVQSFYAAALPLLEPALRYLDEFELSELPNRERKLYWLTLACAEAALSVEVYRSATLPLAPEASRFRVTYSGMDG